MNNQRKETIENTWAWHGTGRFQYDQDGKIVDVLQSIIKLNGLKPLVKDPWLKIEGNLQKSISLAKIRMYSRIYADTMQFDPKEIEYHFHSSRFWFWVIGIIHVLRNPFNVVSHLLSLQTKKESPEQLNDLIVKYRKKNAIPKKPFIFKLLNMPSTDIEGNYGIVIGVSDCSDIAFKMDKRYSLYEDRIKSDIELKRFTYIEVPEKKVSETKKVLEGQNLSIPVYAIENIEEYYRDLGFIKTLKINR